MPAQLIDSRSSAAKHARRGFSRGVSRVLAACFAAVSLAAAPVRASDGAAADSTLETLTAAFESMEFMVQRFGVEGMRPELLKERAAASERVRATLATAKLLPATPGVLTVARAARRVREVFGADVSDPESFAASFRKLLQIYQPYEDLAIQTAGFADSARIFAFRVQRFRTLDLDAASEQTSGRIRRFEVKYGPGSPRLNGVETLVNFFAQRVWPFKPGKNGVSPLELAIGYSTSYATVVEDEARAMSVAEFGVRIYNFAYPLEARSLRQGMAPRYLLVGIAAGAREDGALRWPFEKKPRLGPLVSWGDFKLAYLLGEDDDWRVVVSRQIQLLPHLF